MVRVLAVADEEVATMPSRARDLRVDLVLGAGDLGWDYLEELVALVGVPAAFVPGNHDPRIGRGTPTGPPGLVNLDEQVLTVGGLRIAGLGAASATTRARTSTRRSSTTGGPVTCSAACAGAPTGRSTCS